MNGLNGDHIVRPNVIKRIGDSTYFGGACYLFLGLAQVEVETCSDRRGYLCEMKYSTRIGNFFSSLSIPL